MNFVKKITYLTILALVVVAQSCKKDAKSNEVIIGLAGEPDGLNFILSAGQGYTRQVIERHIVAFMGDTDPQTLAYTPFLAKADALVNTVDTGRYKGYMGYTYEILDEAKWDNGSPVTGNDYAFSLKTILYPKVNAPVWRGAMDFVKDIVVDAQNPKRFTVFTDKKYHLTKDALDNMPIYPAYHYDAKAVMQNYPLSSFTDKTKSAALVNDAALLTFAQDFNTNYSRDKDKVSGCGAYKVELWENGQRLVLKKKDNWWGNTLMASRPALAAYPDRLVYKFYANMQTQLTELKGGGIDVMSNIPPNDYKSLKSDASFLSKYDLYDIPSWTSSSLALNTKSPLLNDKKTRLALAHAIDVDGIINNILGGMGSRMNTLVNAAKSYHRKDLALISFDANTAKQLLADAGWKDSNNNGTVDKVIGGKVTELQLRFLIANKAPIPDVAVLVQNNLKAIGVGSEIIAKDFNTIREEVKKGNFEMTYIAKGGSNANDEFEQTWHSVKGSNETGFGNPTLDVLIDQINSTLDATAQKALYGKFQQIIYDEVPIIMLANPRERIAISKKFDAKPSLLRPYYFEQNFKLK